MTDEAAALPRDAEESIEVLGGGGGRACAGHAGVSAARLRALVRAGKLNCPSSFAALLALDHLREMGLLQDERREG